MDVIEKILDTREFATLPTVASKVLTILNEEAVNVRDIARIIETDPSLTVKLLRIANSPLYGTRVEVTSVRQAIVTLGLSRLTNMVLGISVFSKFMLNTHKKIMPYIKKFWWHVACSAMVSKSLAANIGVYYKENEFIGSLLHDIGKLAMLQFDEEKYMEVIKLIDEEGMCDLEAENSVFRCTHPEVGYHIAKSWNLPDKLQNIILFHHTPEQAEDDVDLVSTVRITDMLCEVWGAGFYEGLECISLGDSKAWELLSNDVDSLKDVDVVQFTYQLEQEFNKSSEFLSLISQE